jgi:hypothetical protein
MKWRPKMNDLERLSYFQGSRVFIGLRTNIFEKVENEHVTLEYVGSFPEWNYLLDRCRNWENTFLYKPVRVSVNGYANWYNSNNNEDRYFDVALVQFDGRPQFSMLKNWHITLEKSDSPVDSRSFDKYQDAFRYDDCTDIWIGYKDREGNQKWISYEGIGTKSPEGLTW